MDSMFFGLAIAFAVLVIFVLIAVFLATSSSNTTTQNLITIPASEYLETLYKFPRIAALSIATDVGIKNFNDMPFVSSLTSSSLTLSDAISSSLNTSSAAPYSFAGLKEYGGVMIYVFTALTTQDNVYYFYRSSQQDLRLYSSATISARYALNVASVFYTNPGTHAYEYTEGSYIFATITATGIVTFYYQETSTAQAYAFATRIVPLFDPTSFIGVFAERGQFFNLENIPSGLLEVSLGAPSLIVSSPFSLRVNSMTLNAAAGVTFNKNVNTTTSTIPNGYDFLFTCSPGDNSLSINGTAIEDYREVALTELQPYFVNNLIESDFLYTDKTRIFMYDAGDLHVIRFFNPSIDQFGILVQSTTSGTYEVTTNTVAPALLGSNYLPFVISQMPPAATSIVGLDGSITLTTIVFSQDATNYSIEFEGTETLTVTKTDVGNGGSFFSFPLLNSALLGSSTQLQIDQWGDTTFVPSNGSYVLTVV
jgi:hypothetical protein